MESFACGICFLIGFQLMLSLMLGVHMAQLIIAVFRGHPHWPWIGFLNFAAGWTLVGWVAALVWSVTATRQPEAIMRIGRPAQPAAA